MSTIRKGAAVTYETPGGVKILAWVRTMHRDGNVTVEARYALPVRSDGPVGYLGYKYRLPAARLTAADVAVIPEGAPLHVKMPSHLEIDTAVEVLRGNTLRVDDDPFTMKACALTALWLLQEKRERAAKLERRLAGGRPR